MRNRLLREQLGFNLNELLMVITLSIFSMSILSIVGTSMYRSVKFVEEQTLLTENGQRALGAITRELRYASRESIEVFENGVSYRKVSLDGAANGEGLNRIGIERVQAENSSLWGTILHHENSEGTVNLAGFMAPTTDALQIVKRPDGTLDISVTTRISRGLRQARSMTFRTSIYPRNK